MFFNQDILFRDGPLAIIWMAGHSKETDKGRRSKHYQLLICSNIPQLCDLVRKHFPEMGSARGMSLKKVATLVRGLGVVYFSKIDDLTKHLSEMRCRVQRTASLREIELETNAGGKAVEFMEPLETDTDEVNKTATFGALDGDGEFTGPTGRSGREDDDGNGNRRSFRTHEMSNDYPGLIPTPSREVFDETENRQTRKGKKRKRDREGEEETAINEETVLQMLQNTVQDPRAHCLNELPDLGAGGAEKDQMEFFNPNGFFGEDDQLIRYMQESTEDSDALQPNVPPLEMISPEEGLGSPPGRRSTAMSGENGNAHRRPTTDDEEEAMQHQSQGEREPIQLQIEPEQNSRELHLQSLDGSLIPRRGKRRSQRLIIDEITTISASVMNAEMQKQRNPLDYDELREVVVKRYAPSKKEALRLEGIACIERAGRKLIGVQLSQMISDRISESKNLKQRVPELPRDQAQQTSIEGQSTSGQGIALQQRDNTGLPDEASAVQERLNLEDYPFPNDVSEVVGVTLGQGEPSVRVDQDDMPAEAVRMDDIENMNEINFNIDRENEPQTNQLEHIRDVLESDDSPDLKTFRIMFPPEQFSRRDAAVGFYQLLRLKGKKIVELEQDVPYGEIIVRQMN